MANEPNLEHFLDLLSEKDFPAKAVERFQENVEEFLWYLDPSRVDEVAKALPKPEVDRDQIFMSLTRLYPLSGAIIQRILTIRLSDYGIIKGFDYQAQMLDTIRSFLRNIEDARPNLTKECKTYSDDIRKCQARIEELRSGTAEYAELRGTRDALLAEKQRLEAEMEGDALNKEVTNLQDEIAVLQKQKQNLAEQQKNLKKEKSSIQKELKALEGRMDAQQDLDLLRTLLKKFPPDAEE
ncbi:hypothetical protein [uncultured Selenomonas sp.]|uniref:hypothetical protein n=1 Tax=uncultured Selenomonas sp. TaxID=159275 RepID=UPI0025D24FD2|nr:hypothetical protein [uncultured Selenomonas sp.]